MFSAKILRFTLCICQKHIIPLLLWIHSMLPKAHSFTSHFHEQQLVLLQAVSELEVWHHFFTCSQNDPKTHSYEDNAELNYPFWWQSSVMPRAFGENGEWPNLSNICKILKKIFENVTVLCFVSINDWKIKKRLKQNIKSHVCVPLSIYRMYSSKYDELTLN